MNQNNYTNRLENQSIICFAPDLWDSMWRNRHQIMSRLSRTNKVLFIEPKTYTFRQGLGLLKKSMIGKSLQNERLKHITNGLWVYQHPPWGVNSRWQVLKQAGFSSRIFAIRHAMRKLQMKYPILWIVDPRHGNMTKYFDKSLVCYHVVDNYAAAPYYSEKIRAEFEEAEKFMLSIADLVIVTSPFLLQEKSKYNSNVCLVRNAVDYDRYSSVRGNNNIPEDMRDVPKPLVGYIGAVNAKLDYELLDTVSRKRPQWSFVFIGDYSNTPRLLAYHKFIHEHSPNVFLLGRRDVADVPHYIHACDICIMPYCRDEYTEAIDSLKLYEYFACEKPIVATDIPAVREHSRLVYIAKDADDFIGKLEEAMTSFTPEQRDLQRATAIQNTWDKRVEQLSFLIQAASDKKKQALHINKELI